MGSEVSDVKVSVVLGSQVCVFYGEISLSHFDNSKTLGP